MTPYDGRVADQILAGWIVARRPDGTLLMRETPERRKQSSFGCLLFTVCWNAMVLILLAGTLDLLPGNWDHAESSPRSVVLAGLALFAMLGLFGIYSVAQMRCGYQEWIAGRNYLELRWGWTFSRQPKSRRIVDGALTLSHTHDTEDRPYTSLEFHAPGSYLNQGVLVSTSDGIVTPAQVEELAQLVSRTTGWSLAVNDERPGKADKTPLTGSTSPPSHRRNLNLPP